MMPVFCWWISWGGGCSILVKQAEVHVCRQHMLRVHVVCAPQASKAHEEEVKVGAGQAQLQGTKSAGRYWIETRRLTKAKFITK